MLSLTTLSFISSLFAPQIARMLAPHSSPDLQLLTAKLLRILLITSTIFGASGLLSGILNAHQRFWLPSLASAIYWVGLIIGLLFFVPSLGIYGLAWGAVLGACLHLCIQLPDLFRLPKRHYTPTLGLGNPSVREVVVLMGPRLISVATVYRLAFGDQLGFPNHDHATRDHRIRDRHRHAANFLGTGCPRRNG